MRYNAFILATMLTVQPGCTTVNHVMSPAAGTKTPGQGSVATQAVPEKGSVRIQGGTVDGRQIQYVSSEIIAARVQVLNADTNVEVAKADFKDGDLASHINKTNKTFSFVIDNLLVANAGVAYNYVAKVEMFADGALTIGIGSSQSSAFKVNSSSATTVAMPNLKLADTPVGNANANLTYVDNPPPPVVIR